VGRGRRIIKMKGSRGEKVGRRGYRKKRNKGKRSGARATRAYWGEKVGLEQTLNSQNVLNRENKQGRTNAGVDPVDEKLRREEKDP